MRVGRDVLAALLALEDSLDLGLEAGFSLLGLPGGYGALGEERLDLLDGLAAGLRVAEERLDGGADAEYAEHNEDVALDVLQRRRREHAEREVEQPVGHRRERHTRRPRPQ